MKNLFGIFACLVTLALAAQGRASFHFVEITEIMTGADGDTSIQYIELTMLADGEDFVDGLPITAKNANGTVTNTVFTFPAGAEAQLAGLTGRKILIATPGFAARAGITPDFTFAGGLFAGSGQVDYAFGTSRVSYGSYTGTGVNGTPAVAAPGNDLRSLQKVAHNHNDSLDFALAANSPTNNANQTGSITVNESFLRITEVNPATGQVEVTNISTQPTTTTVAMPFSHLGNTVSNIPAATVFAPGESKMFNVAGLNATDSDLWLYRDSNTGTAASIVSGLKYGPATGVGDTSVAVAAGIWPSTTAFVATPGGGQSLRMNLIHDAQAPEGWSAGTPNPAAYFGTGVPVSDPVNPNIAKGSITVEVQTVATGLTSPIGLADPDDGTGRIFVFDQVGLIRIIQNGSLLPTPFLDVTSRLVPLGVFGPGTFDERGLIGFALHPLFATNGKIYTYTSEPISGAADFTVSLPPGGVFNNHSVIAEWTVQGGNPNVINVASRRELFRIDDPQFNHNGGGMSFGPDGKLYIAIGDAGAADDQDGQISLGQPQFGHGPDGNGQNPQTIFGNILRIDPDGNNSANGDYGIPVDNPFVGNANLDEIYAYGLRNPFAFSFDSQTGDLYVADVGQHKLEEINVVTSGGNYGWRLKEGSFYFDPGTTASASGIVTTIPVKPLPEDLVDPIAQYDHDDGTSIIGGYVYRGTSIPGLNGKYVFGDFQRGATGRLFYMNANGGAISEFTLGSPDRPLGYFIRGFGQTANGDIYVLGSTGTTPSGTGGAVLRLVNGLLPASVGKDWVLYE